MTPNHQQAAEGVSEKRAMENELCVCGHLKVWHRCLAECTEGGRKCDCRGFQVSPPAASPDPDRQRLAEIRERYEKAYAMVNALCQREREWIMSIPARRDYDPDLVIAASLDDIRYLLDLIERQR